MMECITTVTYSILINGTPTGIICPNRGLRQGNPLSPYLFLLCTEGLHGLISQAASEGHIRGISICRSGPRLTHLFFANDSLVFCRATIQERQYVQDLLRDKTTLFFSKATPQDVQATIICLEFRRSNNMKVLRPSFVCREKQKGQFDFF